MSGGKSCICKGTREEREKNWTVLQLKCNYSAFHGRKRTPSDYSAFRCAGCRMVWRSKSDYVYRILEMNKKENQSS
jgi:predicted secreted protein